MNHKEFYNECLIAYKETGEKPVKYIVDYEKGQGCCVIGVMHKKFIGKMPKEELKIDGHIYSKEQICVKQLSEKLNISVIDLLQASLGFDCFNVKELEIELRKIMLRFNKWFLAGNSVYYKLRPQPKTKPCKLFKMPDESYNYAWEE